MQLNVTTFLFIIGILFIERIYPEGTTSLNQQGNVSLHKSLPLKTCPCGSKLPFNHNHLEFDILNAAKCQQKEMSPYLSIPSLFCSPHHYLNSTN